jgi:hypothetical protein
MATAIRDRVAQRPSRFSEDMFSMPRPQHPEPKPGNSHPASERCPYCDQLLPHAPHGAVSVLFGGIRKLFSAVLVILVAVIRCARLILAGCLCLIGLLGACCRSLGIRIAHPDDRRFLTLPRRGRP